MIKLKKEALDFSNLLKKVSSYHPAPDFPLLEKSYQLAQEAHQGQKRLSGEPVINHCLAVAHYLADWRLDSASLAAGLLHDAVEDTSLTLEKIKKELGEDVAKLVDGVTKVGRLRMRGPSSEDFIETLRKMFLAMSRDLRVVIIKIADRYHNMQTLEYLPPDKAKGIAEETLEVYAPLAERLGIGEIKGQLEDLAFPYVYPEDYQWLKKYAAPYYQKAEKRIERVRRELLHALAQEGLRVEINGRAKHLYSLWRKLLRPEINKDIEKVYDLMALRILTEKVADCYTALGVVHKLYRPVPYLGVRDWIAQPKPNGYQSIHTNVFLGDGRIIEVQIRTHQMHEQAEYGIAAHWYLAQLKLKNKLTSKTIDEGKFFSPAEKLAWVRQLADWQKEIIDSHEFIDSVKFDALSHRIFVFSPKGDAYDLPEGATPIDFAYAVHSQLGDQAVGAKVNGKMVPLDYHLKSGEVVEILVNKNKKEPSADWLDFVVTRQARKKISQKLRYN
jgi:guanosine-3',5'-bis(diphosphate) 3'-pyrophosphohydrolase